MPMKPILMLKAGDRIAANKLITKLLIQNSFKYARECVDIGGGIMPGTRLTIMEVNPGERWVIAYFDPPDYDPMLRRCLKIDGEMLGLNFDLVPSP